MGRFHLVKTTVLTLQGNNMHVKLIYKQRSRFFSYVFIQFDLIFIQHVSMKLCTTLFRTEFVSLWHFGIVFQRHPPHSHKTTESIYPVTCFVALPTNVCFLFTERVMENEQKVHTVPHLLVKYPSSCSFCFLPQRPVPWVCTFFWSNEVMYEKCIEKNSHAITYQNLFLRNEVDILKRSGPS